MPLAYTSNYTEEIEDVEAVGLRNEQTDSSALPRRSEREQAEDVPTDGQPKVTSKVAVSSTLQSRYQLISEEHRNTSWL